VSTDESNRLPGRKSGDPYLPICEDLHTLLTRKRGYYGCAQEDPLQNAMGVQEQGIAPWLYQLARIGEKVRRLGGLREALVNGEPRSFDQVKETLQDIAGHAVVALAVLEKEYEDESCRH
jgi:hypothetical protein